LTGGRGLPGFALITACSAPDIPLFFAPVISRKSPGFQILRTVARDFEKKEGAPEGPEGRSTYPSKTFGCNSDDL
jgi:hypothetical protein